MDRSLPLHIHQTSAVARAFVRSYPTEILLRELFVNARQAGARRLRVDVCTDPTNATRNQVAVDDDGHGIADPQAVLDTGRSAWPPHVADADVPTGLGLFAFAQRGLQITSRPQATDGTLATAWHADLVPDHFTGKARALIMHGPPFPQAHGTRIVFSAPESLPSLLAMTQRLAAYYPLPITFSGNTFSRQPLYKPDPGRFLEGAFHREHYLGVTAGVFRGPRPQSDPALCVRGLPVDAVIPGLASIDGRHLHVKLDVHGPRPVSLERIDRTGLIDDASTYELQQMARHALYRAIAAHNPDLPLPYPVWRDAQACGVSLPTGTPRLRPLPDLVTAPPPTAPPPRPQSVDPHTALVVPRRLSQHLRGLLVYVAAGGRHPWHFFDDNALVRGYPWFDRLRKISDVRVRHLTDGREYPLDETTRLPAGHRPQALYVDVSVYDPRTGDHDTIRLNTDAVAAPHVNVFVLTPAHPAVVITDQARPKTEDLQHLLVHSHFDLDDEVPPARHAAAVYEHARFHALAAVHGLETALEDRIRSRFEHLLPKVLHDRYRTDLSTDKKAVHVTVRKHP